MSSNSATLADLAHARIRRGARKQVVVLGVIIEQMTPQNGHVMGGGQVAGFGQAMGVFEGGARHAQRLGGAVHAAGKLCLGPRQRLADGSGRIIGRFYSRTPDQIAQGNALACLQAQL